MTAEIRSSAERLVSAARQYMCAHFRIRDSVANPAAQLDPTFLVEGITDLGASIVRW